MNLLESTPIRTEKCPRIEDRKRISAEFAGYLADESRTQAEGLDVIFFPENPAQVAGAVTQCHDAGMKLTVAGARTGIVGGAVPLKSDAVVALEKLNHIKSVRYDPDRDAFFARVQPGLVLADFQEALRTTRPADLPWISDKNREMGMKKIKTADGRLFYPVDPTETSAQIGGTVATNASGARTFHYGATREWVEGVTVVLSSGEILQLRRGDATADDGIFRLANSLGQETTIDLPDLNIPDTKHTAGYYLVHGMDAVDLFVGSEGTLGLLVEIELRLAFEPPERLFLTAFLPSEENVIEFVNRARISEEIDPLAIEYIGPKALDLLRDKRRKEGASSGVPPLDGNAGCAVYLEIKFDGDDEFRKIYDFLEQELQVAGTTASKSWAGFSPGELGRMKEFRHAVPEYVNGIIGRRQRKVPALHKIGTDMAVPNERLGDVMSVYRKTLEDSGLQYVIFGHIGDNHLHINILPENKAELDRAMALYKSFADNVVAMEGSVSAEHGIGRIKRDFLSVQFSNEELEQMENVRRQFDPEGMFNPGVLF